MTEKELKKLNRQELLEVLLAQSKKIDRLQKQLGEAQEKLTKRELAIAEAGSIAEAALVLNRVFDDAQKAADQYLDNIRRLKEQAEREAADAGRKGAEDVREEADRVLLMKQQTEKECAALREETDREKEQCRIECAEMRAQTESECAALKEEAEREREQAEKECADMKTRADGQIRHSLLRTKYAINQMLGLYAGEVEKRVKKLQRWDRRMGAMHERKTEKRASHSQE